MPKQSPLRLIKRWRRYEEKGDLRFIPHITRGVYILYRRDENAKPNVYNVVYIGVAGVAQDAERGIGARLRQHAKSKSKEWTHYSFFEVHDNVTRDEILELESFLLAIFRHDPRIELANKQRSSRRFWQLRQNTVWPDVDARKPKHT